MILGLGIDIVEISRIEKALQTGNFLTRVFTPHEIDYCNSRKSQSSASFAARFAAKEAVMKALEENSKKACWLEIEVVNNDHGAPEVVLHGDTSKCAQEKGVSSIFISLSHHRTSAIAQVILCSN